MRLPFLFPAVFLLFLASLVQGEPAASPPQATRPAAEHAAAAGVVSDDAPAPLLAIGGILLLVGILGVRAVRAQQAHPRA
ncbi:MAG: hypothetical protein ACM336_15580 [Acidobacteriota bacterium]